MRLARGLIVTWFSWILCVPMAFAEEMICKNPGREYYLVYHQSDPTVLINPDSDNAEWRVLSVLFDDRQHIVVADLGQPGMTAQVHFRPYRMVEIFSTGELVQTDGCRS
ncbi:hypothetical protein [Devosia neptuniae]|uniref:hypothetical protein n=1 Tax=Devosia neptuniae TaxID=191302 RepID=UPI0022AFEEC8|nr:hypothetical protein [Devosia neptuniae]MCZ4345498.1 hypothetical protein [Devosia neptuniae]